MTWESFRSGRVRLIPRENQPDEYIEMVGTPDWVLEVVSRSSVRRDNEYLMTAYHRARIPEYWLVSGLGDQIDFRILERRERRYVPVRPEDDRHRSRVLNARFRIERQRDPLGYWQYRLRVKEA